LHSWRKSKNVGPHSVPDSIDDRQTTTNLFDATKFLDALGVNFGRKLDTKVRSHGNASWASDLALVSRGKAEARSSPHPGMRVWHECVHQEGAS
jgi:hypothetical protein